MDRQKYILLVFFFIVVTNIITSTVTIVGTARNIEMIANLFIRSNIIIYENNSSDNTLEILNKWSDESPLNVEIISEKNIPGLRTHRLAKGA